MTHGSFGITLNGDTRSHFERERRRVMRYLERDGSLVWCECVFPLCQNLFFKGPLAPSRHFFLRLLWSPELKPWTCFATALSPRGSGSFQEWYSLSKLAIGIDFLIPHGLAPWWKIVLVLLFFLFGVDALLKGFCQTLLTVQAQVLQQLSTATKGGPYGWVPRTFSLSVGKLGSEGKGSSNIFVGSRVENLKCFQV